MPFRAVLDPVAAAGLPDIDVSIASAPKSTAWILIF
jgi:hypothetical protein